MQNAKQKSAFIILTSVFLCLMAAVFLLYPGTGGYQTIQDAKFTAFCVICGGYAALMGLCALEGMAVGAARPQKPTALLRQSSWAQRMALVYLIFTWLSALLSAYWPETIVGASRYEGALTITLYCVCFLLVSAFGRADGRLLALFAAAVFLFGCLAAAQLRGFNPLGLYPGGCTYFDAGKAYSGAYLGTIGNVDLAAAFYCLAIPLLLVPVCRSKARKRFFLLPPLILSCWVLVRMNVLAGFVGLGCGLLFSLPFLVPCSRAQRRLLLGCLAGLAAAILLTLRFFDAGSGFLHELHELLNGRAEETFGSGRLHIWQCVAEALPGHILFGTGPDTMLHTGLQAFSRYDAALGKTLVSQIDVAHNEYLNILSQQGILALAAYLAMLADLALRWARQARNDLAAAALGCAAACYCIQAFFGFSMCITAPFFWLTLALLDGRLRAMQSDANFTAKHKNRDK
jgi:O-antigen ligase